MENVIAAAGADARPAERLFFGWRVVGAAFVVAIFGWGICFYGPPVLLYAIHARRGWPLPLISGAVTLHFLLGALVVANLPACYRRWGVPAVTRGGRAPRCLGHLRLDRRRAALAALRRHLAERRRLGRHRRGGDQRHGLTLVRAPAPGGALPRL